MTNERADFYPQPVHIRLGSEELEIVSLDGAVHFIRSLRHDRLGNYAEMLLAQMEAANRPAQQAEAWTAFRTWSSACGLSSQEYRTAA